MVDVQFDIPAYPSLANRVLRSLRLAIIRGDYTSGQRLLEHDLARKYGVSRGPVRDALQRLEQEDLVRSYQRRGVYVVGLTRKAIEEIYDMRLLLETHAAQLVLQRHLFSALARRERQGH